MNIISKCVFSLFQYINMLPGETQRDSHSKLWGELTNSRRKQTCFCCVKGKEKMPTIPNTVPNMFPF